MAAERNRERQQRPAGKHHRYPFLLLMLDGNRQNQRPDLVPGVPIYPVNQTIYNWFNPAAFAVPAKNTWGNLGRNIARGPGYYELDTALEKKIPMTSG